MRRERCRLHQRRIGEDNQNGAVPPFHCRPRGKHRMRRAELLGLLEDFGAGRDPCSFGPHRVHAGPHDHGGALGAQRADGRQHVRQHRAPADGMQALGQLGVHAHALAGGKDNDQERAVDHWRCFVWELHAVRLYHLIGTPA